MTGAAEENSLRVSGEQRNGNSSVMSWGSNLDPQDKYAATQEQAAKLNMSPER